MLHFAMKHEQFSDKSFKTLSNIILFAPLSDILPLSQNSGNTNFESSYRIMSIDK